MNIVGKISAAAVSGLAALGLAAALSPDLSADSTDTAEKRSGMRLHTDALTGCQYLSVPFGGITPRLNSDGVPMCEGSK